MPRLRILFVDDDQNILIGLQRMLRPLRQEWDVHFVDSGAAALCELDAAPFDVIVSDMRMPGMDGRELLTRVMERHPSVVRIALSGQSDLETIFGSIGPTHQYLSKPCDSGVLIATITRACALRNVLASEDLKRVISRIGALPSLPEMYVELEQELRSPETSIHRVGRMMASDIGMSAKVLQLVNSAFFGVARHVSSVELATSLLGLDTIRTLVLSVHIFSQFRGPAVAGFSAEALWSHCAQTAVCAELIARAEGSRKQECGDALMAGLLHDAGKLILVANFPTEYAAALDLANGQAMPIWRAEAEVFCVTHAEVGAYLMSLWGLPDEIVEAVAHHHAPAAVAGGGFGTLAAVHVADALVHSRAGRSDDRGLALDEGYLDRLGKTERIAAWKDACEAALGARGNG